MNKQLYRVIGWNLMQLRQSKELRQEDLARLTGLSRHQVSRIECGLGNITLDNLMKVSDFFEIPVARLCEEKKRNRDLEFRLRDTHQEKEDLKFSKEFYESPRLKIMELNSRRVRRIKIQKDQVYDLFVLDGKILMFYETYSMELKKHQTLSLKGQGLLRLKSSSLFKTSRLLALQASAV